jgi:hypothetical protein
VYFFNAQKSDTGCGDVGSEPFTISNPKFNLKYWCIKFTATWNQYKAHSTSKKTHQTKTFSNFITAANWAEFEPKIGGLPSAAVEYTLTFQSNSTYCHFNV